MDAMRRSSSERMPPPPSLSLSGVITRSKYQLRLRNPTGNFQSSSAGCGSYSVNYSSDEDDDHMLVSDILKKAKLNEECSVEDDGEPSHILIKDLRARRVYSPQSAVGTFSCSSPNVDIVESKVGSGCRDLEMVNSGSGSASIAENKDRAGDVSKRDGEIDSLGEKLPSESWGKDEINSILSSIANEYRSEKDDDLYSDGALKSTNKETESALVGFPCKAQNTDHANSESINKGTQLQYFRGCHDGTGAFERLDNVNGLPQLTTPPDDIETCGKVKVDEDGAKQVVEASHIKDAQLTGNTDGKLEESLCPNAGAEKDSLKSKSVLRPRMQRRLFKSPGSVNYRRLLPFIVNMIKDDSGTSILGHRRDDEKVNDEKQFQFPLPSLSQGASKDQLRTDSRPRNGIDEVRVLADKSDLSGGSESKLTSYQDLPESPKQLGAKEAVHDCSSVPSVNEHVEISLECSSNTEAEEVVDARHDKDVANAVPSNVHGCKAEAVGGVDTSEKLGVVNQQCLSLPNNKNARHDKDVANAVPSNVHGCKAEAVGGVDTSEKLGVVNQQCLSLPDADTCGDNKNAPGSVDVINTLDLTPSNQSNAGEGFCPNASKGKNKVLRSKSVLKPCLQKTLFKTPGSVSYKRLLPFLKDIAKDDCGAPKLGQDQKDERGMRCQPPLLFQSPESPIDELKTDSCPMHDTIEEANAIQDNTNEDCNSECSLNLPNSVSKIDSQFTPSSPIMNEITPVDHYASVSHQLLDFTEAKRDSSSNGGMHLDTDLCCQKLQTKTLEWRTTPTIGLRKGILKRNPRGCRGHCTCLNCASFRLHAERAFEFSGNLLLDAEEVALDLMKELSHLRIMLEKRTDGANNHSVLDENQVKEACRKSLAAEQLAKERLSEMNDDLNIHCRITSFQQPRVKFANYIEEKVMSPGRLSGQK